MTEQQLGQIVSKLDGLRDQVSTLTVHVESLVGNGQPGRVRLIEEHMDKLQAQVDRWRGALQLLSFFTLLLGGADIIAVWHTLSK